MDVVSVVIVQEHEHADVGYGAEIDEVEQFIFDKSLIESHIDQVLNNA